MSQNQSPDELEQLLPWQVNGTLSRGQQARLEQLLKEYPAARRDLAFLQEIAAAMRQEHHHYDEQSTLANLLARVQPTAQTDSGRKEASARPRPWLDRLLAVFEPKFAFAVLTIGVQGILIGTLINRADAPHFSATRSLATTAPAAQQVLRVSFVPTASEHDIRLLLIAAHARILYGPTQLGDYYVGAGHTGGGPDETLLKQSKLVDTVTRLDRIPEDVD